MKCMPRLAVLAALAAIMVACQSTSPSEQSPRSSARGGPALPIEPGVAADLGYVTQWVVDLALARGQSVRTVTVLEELGIVVVVQKPMNLVTALSLRTGEAQWRQVIGGSDEELFNAHVVNPNQLLLNSEKRVFVINAVDGRIEGLSNLDSTVVSNPVVSGEVAVFGGRNGIVFAHDLNTGFNRWQYRLVGSILTAPVASGANVFVADSAGGYAMLDAADGTLMWRNRTWGPVTAQPAVALASIYVASRDRSLYSFNRINGADNWIYRVTVPLTEGPQPMGRLVFQPVTGQGLHAINASDGTLRWTHPDIIKPIKLIGETILFLDRGKLLMLHTDDGRVVRTSPTRPLATIATGPSNSLIVVSERGQIVRLNPRQ